MQVFVLEFWLFVYALSPLVAAGRLLAPTIPINPSLSGNFTTRRTSYNRTVLRLEEFPVPIEVFAEVTYPVGVTLGPRPLVLFIHGQRDSCFSAALNTTTAEWPCVSPNVPLPSYKGFRYITNVLASQGYIAVSLAANGINGQDTSIYNTLAWKAPGIAARSKLIRHHLALWAQWNNTGGDPLGSLFRGEVDLNRVVLVGHDRSGEAIHRAAIEASITDPYTIVGLMSFGPTATGRQVTPDVHSATILPLCDGKVENSQGQLYIDASRDVAYSEALRSAVLVPGANSNYFNTEWTPGTAVAKTEDDWLNPYDTVCGPNKNNTRLRPQEQQAVGLAYTLALVRLAANRDVAMLPLLDGSFVRPNVIGRAEVTTCAVGGARNRVLYRPEDMGMPLLQNGMNGRECVGNAYSNSSYPLCRDGLFGGERYRVISPHFTKAIGPSEAFTLAVPIVLELEWAYRMGASVQFPIRGVFANFSGLDWIDVRIASDRYYYSDRGPPSFELVVIDRNGKNATLQSDLSAIEQWPDVVPDTYSFRPVTRIHASTLRGSLASVRNRVDVSGIVAVQLVTRFDSGKVWILDVATSQARIRNPTILNLPVISVQSTSVPEGDGLQSYSLNITSDQPLTLPGSIWVTRYDRFWNIIDGFQVDLVPGGSSLVVASILVFKGIRDILYDPYSQNFYVGIEAKKGVVTGAYIGNLTAEEDDPNPTFSVVSSNVTATEGSMLRWTVELSSPALYRNIYFSVVAPTIGTELMTNDVDPYWLQRLGKKVPASPVPLSRLNINIRLDFATNVTRRFLTIPLVSDGQAEGDEVIALKSYWYDLEEYTRNANFSLIGTVLAHP